MHRDSTGFPLSVKPSHLFDSPEQMGTAEILSMIVDRACSYVPDVPVGEIFKSSKALTSVEPKEARTRVEPKETLTSVRKVSVSASNLVRNEIVLN